MKKHPTSGGSRRRPARPSGGSVPVGRDSIAATRALLGIILAASLLLLASCAAPRTATTMASTTVARHHDTIRVADTLRVCDTIRVTHQGDTVRIDHSRTIVRDRWRDRLRTDTLIRRDTLTITRQVARPLTLWQRTLEGFGLAAITLAALAIIVALVRARI